MKNLLPLIVVGILILGGFGAFAVSLSKNKNIETTIITFSDPIININNNYISIDIPEATTFTWESKKPMLPVYTKVYTYPFGTKIENIDVSFSDQIKKEILMPIQPVPETLMRSVYATHKVEESDTMITYSDIDIYPEQQFNYTQFNIFHKKIEFIIQKLQVSLLPIQYLKKFLNSKMNMIF